MVVMVSVNSFRIAVAATRCCKKFKTGAYLDIVLSLNVLFHAQPHDRSAEVRTEEDGDV